MRHHLHIALHVADRERSTAFYARVFGQEPDKEACGYARFTLEDPALVLTLNARKEVRTGDRLSHLGIRMGDRATFETFRDRLRAAGLIAREEHAVTCCHAVQDKVWTEDPDGNSWEFYELLEDLDPTAATARSGGCC